MTKHELLSTIIAVILSTGIMYALNTDKPNEEPIMTTENTLQAKLLKQLDKWTEMSDSTAKQLREAGHKDAALSHEGQSQAYWNVRQFIEVNFDEHQ